MCDDMELNLNLSNTCNRGDRRDGSDDRHLYEIEEFDPYIEISETPHSYILIAYLPGT